MNVTVRPVEPNDLDQIDLMRREAFRAPFKPDLFLRYGLVATRENQVRPLCVQRLTVSISAVARCALRSSIPSSSL